MANYKWTFPSGMISQITSGKIELSPTYTPNYTTSDGGFSVTVNDGATATAYTITCMTEDGSCSTTGTLTIKDCGGGDCDLEIYVDGDPTAQTGGTFQFSHEEIPTTCDLDIYVDGDPRVQTGGTFQFTHEEIPCEANGLTISSEYHDTVIIANLSGYEGGNLEFNWDNTWLYNINYNNGVIYGFDVQANQNMSPRSVEVTITCENGCGCNGETFTVTQEGSCSLTINCQGNPTVASGGVFQFSHD